MDGVAHTRVGRDAVVRVIGGHPVFFKSDVLKQGTEANRLVNFGFAFWTQINGLGVAPPFHVEHALGGPTVFIVSNQGPIGIAAQGCLSCT